LVIEKTRVRGDYLESNENGNTTYQTLCNATKAVTATGKVLSCEHLQKKTDVK
jgi:hypothetical protein